MLITVLEKTGSITEVKLCQFSIILRIVYLRVLYRRFSIL